MLPLHVYQKPYPSRFEANWFTEGRRYFDRQWLAKNRKPIFSILVVFTISVYFLWQSKLLGRQLEDIPPTPGYSRTRPDYSNWPVERRAEAVKEAFGHAYASYERFAMPADELRPLRNGSQQNFNGWGVTMFDALDTLWLMDLTPQFERALNWVSLASFHTRKDHSIMFFETVIRYLGGLLSAYALSGNKVLLDKADLLGRKLLPAFDTDTGMPAFAVNTDSGAIDLGPRQGGAVLAEIASCQMEYKYLAYLTGSRDYFRLVEKTTDWMAQGQLSNGMWNTEWNITTGKQVDDHITIGALADSGYEYLLKQYLMSDRSEKRLRDMYLKAASGIIRNLLFLSPTRRILYVTDIYGASSPVTNASEPPKIYQTGRFEHLSCFLPGLLALGAHSLQDDADLSAEVRHELELQMLAAKGLARSCWLMYADQPSGLAPEEVVFDRRWMNSVEKDGGSSQEQQLKEEPWMDSVEAWRRSRTGGAQRDTEPPGVGEGAGAARPLVHSGMEEKDYFVLTSKYLLRPETVESMYILYRTTGDPIWRERGWQIFLAIEAHCRQRSGYSSVLGVDRAKPDIPTPLDEMPSYALAETWKYLYLLFLDHDPLPMEKFVFNTEAHPFPVFRWSDEEKSAYGIR